MSTSAITPDSFMASQRPDLDPDSFMQASNRPGVKRPLNPITEEIDRRAANPMAGFPGGTTGAPAKAGPAALIAGTAGLGLGAAAVAGPAGLMAAGRAAIPFAAAEGINQARRHIPGGKFIPPGSEMLPFLIGGGKGRAAEAAEAEEAAPSLTEQMSAPETPPGSATWQRPLPAPEAGPAGAPTPAAARPSLSQQMEAAQPERRVSQSMYAGPERRIAPEMRGFETAPPLPMERIGIDYRPAEDLGVKVRAQTEATKGPINRGSKALSQSESLRRPATSNKLIQNMGGKPIETVTGEREPYIPIGFREGPPKGTMVPQSSEEMQAALDMSLRRAKRGNPIQ